MTALENIKAAIENKPHGAYVEVRAADVVSVASGIPTDKHTGTTNALASGAAGALAGSSAETTVVQIAGQLRELVKVAESNG